MRIRRIRIGEYGLGEYGLGEYGLGEYGLGEYGLGEYGLGKYGLGEMQCNRIDMLASLLFWLAVRVKFQNSTAQISCDMYIIYTKFLKKTLGRLVKVYE